MNEKKLAARQYDHRQLIRRQALKLAELLWQSPEYRQFVAAKRRLEADGEHSLMLAELRQQQMELRMAAMIGEDVGEDYLDFESMYLELSEEPAINDYLFAEGRFFRLISDVEEVFSDKLELWQSAGGETERPAYSINLN